MSVGSDQRPPMNDTPTGSGPTKPLAPVIPAYPLTAAALDDEMYPSKLSPLTGSMTQAGLFVGATMASGSFAAIASSIAAWITGVVAARAAAQSGSDLPPVDSARSNTRLFQGRPVRGPSRFLWPLLKSIRSCSVFG